MRCPHAHRHGDCALFVPLSPKVLHVRACACAQPLFTKIINVTGSPAVIKQDGTVDVDLFESEILTHTKINGFPMPLFPLMWEVNAWRHPVIGEVRCA
jgi:hypothetical protein